MSRDTGEDRASWIAAEIQYALRALHDAEDQARRYAEEAAGSGRTEGWEYLRAEGLIAALAVIADDLRAALWRATRTRVEMAGREMNH